MTHLGDDPDYLFGEYSGELYFRTFTLPDDVDVEEDAVLFIRTYDNTLDTKRFYLNTERIFNVLEPHAGNPKEWMLDIGVIYSGILRPGVNCLHSGFAEFGDDFLFDNLVLMYKTREGESNPVSPEDEIKWVKEINEFTDKLKKEVEQKKKFFI